ncbi:MAG: undecaprenyl/decaprenyl-phosphate alpha-N-acetylglucosaminyl 1-phosphate transferase [Alkalinema sp. RU_4_3]|nr:undecaprenyl/decaprenyl-phosphate alpha-N-acetylglucosaminyl 1-phosphate transferase [Alkalinema sp. RU_4_3]
MANVDMIFLVVFASALFTVLLISPRIKQLGLQLGIVDYPDGRKLHHQPMVRIGGVGIAIGTVFAATLGLAGLALTGQTATQPWLNVIGVLVVGVGSFTIGLADDRWSISPKLRLGLQAIVTVIAWSLGLQIHYLPIPGIGAIALGLFSLPITFLWLAGVTNAINWLDGLDGLATGISLIASVMFGLIGWQQGDLTIVILALALAGATLGFLRYNALPAQMYMGDGGSYLIGGMLAGLGILSIGSSDAFNLNATPYIILAVPIIDMVLVIISRQMDGKSPFFPDQRHLHHRLLRLKLSKQTVVNLIYALMAWAGLAGNLLDKASYWSWINVMALAIVMIFVNRTALQTAAAPINNAVVNPVEQ